MTDIKISEMEFKSASKTDFIPVINPITDPSKNYIVLAGDLNFERIIRWNADASFLVDDYIIYNSSTVKGIFRVVTNTSPGDAPEGTASNKFRSVALEFVPNVFIGVYSGGTVNFGNIGDVRTGKLIFPPGISLSGSSTSPDTFNISASSNLTNASFNNCIIRSSLGCPGQTPSISLRNFYGYDSFFWGTVEFWGTTSGGAIQGRSIDFEIHG